MMKQRHKHLKPQSIKTMKNLFFTENAKFATRMTKYKIETNIYILNMIILVGRGKFYYI